MQNNIIDIIFFPEIALTILIVLLLLLGLFQKVNSFNNVCNLSSIVLIIIIFLIYLDPKFIFLEYQSFFTNSYFIKFFKYLIVGGSLITILISKKYFIESDLISFEIPILILFSTLGMMILVSSSDLISMYLGIELQSLALYVLAAIKRDSLKSSESGVKYFVLGALSSGILLYGCSLIYGFSGTTNFQEIHNNLQSLNHLNLGLIFGLVFILVGLAFKISAVPFHMWTPDVYEGAPTSITAFFAIVPKIAVLQLYLDFA